jgi:muramoyltetrapeptide carboxypeptidase LdcA involved in peptidoglycan recycling
MEPIRPPRLRTGDTVAVLTPSWGGPGLFPAVFDSGLRVLVEVFGLRVVEYPSTRAQVEFLSRHPKARADDLRRAFADSKVRAVIASIGGDDSVRLLPFLDREMFRADPKILMGFSDTTTLLAYANQSGLVTFHGPSVMAGLSQLRALPRAFEEHLRAMLFDAPESYTYAPYGCYCEGYPSWRDVANVGQIAPLHTEDAVPRLLQGRGVARGRLFGGCLDVLEMVKGTPFWPGTDFWNDRVLFLETSEEAPSPELVTRWLRNYGVQGVFDRVSAVLVGRTRGYSVEGRRALERAFIDVVAGEFGRPELPILANLDFGHTDPQWVLPLGARAEVDCDALRLRLLEPAVA